MTLLLCTVVHHRMMGHSLHQHVLSLATDELHQKLLRKFANSIHLYLIQKFREDWCGWDFAPMRMPPQLLQLARSSDEGVKMEHKDQQVSPSNLAQVLCFPNIYMFVCIIHAAPLFAAASCSIKCMYVHVYPFV